MGILSSCSTAYVCGVGALTFGTNCKEASEDDNEKSTVKRASSEDFVRGS